MKQDSEIHYYIDDIDSIFAEINDKIFIYNYVKRDFVPCSIGLDIMKWHEFPASELQEMIKETSKNLIAMMKDNKRKVIIVPFYLFK